MMKFGSLGSIPVSSQSLLETGSFVPVSQNGLELLLKQQQQPTPAPFALLPDLGLGCIGPYPQLGSATKSPTSQHLPSIFDQEIFRQLMLPSSHDCSLQQLFQAYGGRSISAAVSDAIALSNQASPDSTQSSSDQRQAYKTSGAKTDAPKSQGKNSRKSVKKSVQNKEKIDINKQILRTKILQRLSASATSEQQAKTSTCFVQSVPVSASNAMAPRKLNRAPSVKKQQSSISGAAEVPATSDCCPVLVRDSPPMMLGLMPPSLIISSLASQVPARPDLMMSNNKPASPPRELPQSAPSSPLNLRRTEASTSPSTLSTHSLLAPSPETEPECDEEDSARLVVVEEPQPSLPAQVDVIRSFASRAVPSPDLGYSRSCNGDEPGCSGCTLSEAAGDELEPMARNRSLSCFVTGSRTSAFSPVVRGGQWRPAVIRQPLALGDAPAHAQDHGQLLPLGPDISRYFERRRRNNEAAKRCRANRRVLFERRFQRASELEQENVELKEAVRRLNQQVCDLKHQLGAKRPRVDAGGDVTGQGSSLAPASPPTRPNEDAAPLDFSQKRLGY